MLCERCTEKAFTRRKLMITCKSCGREEYVSLYNNNKCKDCNEKAGTCEECGRPVGKEYLR